ncbi:MAG: SDR family oxidoreductase [Opitutus sp.]
MTIFLAGASGLVGSAFAKSAERRGHRVVGVVGAFRGEIDGVAQLLPLDLGNQDATTAAVLDVFPQAIANCAAVSMPDACEADPARAQALNVALPATLARLAHHVSARMIHLSSEQVFDGARGEPFGRSDVPSPINLYGRQKLESERAVHAAAPECAVTLRPPLLTGNSVTGRRSLHERLFFDWMEGRTPRLFTDELRQPCLAENLAEVMVELCERNDLRGVFHWAGVELMSRHEIGVRVREHFKLTEREAPIAATTRSDNPLAARSRPRCLALDSDPLPGLLKTRQQSLEEQLAGLNIPPSCRGWYHSR